MSKYTIEHGYHKNGRWRYVLCAPVLIAVLVFFAGRQQSQPQSIASQIGKPAAVTPTMEQLKITTPLPWPDYGQAAYGVVDDGVLAQSKEEMKPVPIASLAKVITALAVLDKKPLTPGEQGDMITLTEADEALYREYVAKDGTVVPVKAGTQLSQYQALQAVLLPSANNVSDTLVLWAFGSMEAYTTYANDLLKKWGISETTVADASGYSPQTKSTAADMVKIGMRYMQNPVLQEIALQPQATIPFAGVIHNDNARINKDGIIGIKIGFTEQAGRTFLAADIKTENKNEISVAAVLGADDMLTAMQDAERLLKTGNKGHEQLAQKTTESRLN